MFINFFLQKNPKGIIPEATFTKVKFPENLVEKPKNKLISQGCLYLLFFICYNFFQM